jgi:hypothetical protein
MFVILPNFWYIYVSLEWEVFWWFIIEVNNFVEFQ